MTKQTEALKLALDAICGSGDFLFNWHDCEPNNEREMQRYQATLAANEKAFKVIREALAEQPAQQEPVAWMQNTTAGLYVIDHCDEWHCIPLYTSPPASKPWVGLTEKEKRDARNSVSYSPLAMTMGEWTEAVQDATESKLKEKNNG